jgi:integrase
LFRAARDPVFASRTGTPLGHRNVTRRAFEAARDLAGLSQGLSFHDLRHAAASRLIHEGHSPVVVAKILGHSDPAMTLRVYSHVYEKSETDEAIRRALTGAGS